MFQSLFDTVDLPRTLSKKAATLRLDGLREELAEKLTKVSDSKSTAAHLQSQVRRIVAQIAECRAVIGPPV